MLNIHEYRKVGDKYELNEERKGQMPRHMKRSWKLKAVNKITKQSLNYQNRN